MKQLLLTGHVTTQLSQNSERDQLKPHANIQSEKHPCFYIVNSSVNSSPNFIKNDKICKS